MAKRFGTDAGFRIANEALQIFGGYGYLKESGVDVVVGLRSGSPRQDTAYAAALQSKTPGWAAVWGQGGELPHPGVPGGAD